MRRYYVDASYAYLLAAARRIETLSNMVRTGKDVDGANLGPAALLRAQRSLEELKALCNDPNATTNEEPS